MFKLVVLSALVAIAVAKPGGYYGAVGVAPVVAQTYLAPAAVSSTYREDVISKPAAVAYTAPAVAYAAPAIAYAAPVVHKTVVAAPVVYAAPAAVSHTYRADLVSSPVVAKTIVSPAAYSYGPAVHAW